MSTPITIGRVAELVRSKNAGPFWQTLDIFFANDEDYRAVADNPALNADAIARLYLIGTGNIHIWRIPEIPAVKISFPRPTVQGGWDDRDMHAGQQHVPLALLVLEPPD